MPVKIEKYIGRIVEVIYQDSKGKYSKRRVSIYSVRDGKVRVLDWDKKSFRTLKKDRVISVIPDHLPIGMRIKLDKNGVCE